MPRISSKGKCFLCEKTFGKAAMTRHLAVCRAKQEAVAGTPAKPSHVRGGYFHLLVEGAGLTQYWLHLDVRGNAKLADLDQFLRGIWLECCGHLSAFRIDDNSYSAAPMRDLDEKGMNVALNRVLRPGMKFSHEYDFGSTTHLTLKVVGERVGEIRDDATVILARNDPPDIPCGNCGKPATQVCGQCGYDPEGWLCDACAADHECGEEMLLPVVNSPRVGVCAYTGPGCDAEDEFFYEGDGEDDEQDETS